MSVEASLLLAAAAAFSVVNGVNDGGTLVALGLKIPSLDVKAAVALLAGAVVFVPALVGTRVASTLATRLVSFQGDIGQLALFVAVLSAIVVAVGLSRLGLPTSLTLALVGGVAGAGVGYGLPVAWLTIGLVLALGALAPVVGAVGAFALSRAAHRLPMTGVASRRIRLLHRFAFGLQCLAYGANDGQKMLAIFAVASGAALAPVAGSAPQLVAIGALFVLGTFIGLRQFAGTIGGGVLPLRPPNAVAAELSAAVSVLFSASLGAPVSMTQATAGALVGTGVSEGYKRVRWRAAFQIVLAWVFTLPVSAALAGTLAYLTAALL